MGSRLTIRVIIGGFLIIIFGLFYLQVVRGNYYLRRAKSNYVKIINLPSIRGSIFDRRGTLIAQDRPIFNIAVIPYQIEGKREFIFEKLAEVADVDKEIITINYQKNFQNVFSPVEVLIDVDKSKALKIKEVLQDNVLIRIIPQRYYPFSYLYSHVLGYVKKAEVIYQDIKRYGYSPFQRVGINGIERFYDHLLRGEDGVELIEVDSRGQVMGFLGKRSKRKGNDIYLTVDTRFQKIAYQSLGNFRGAIIIMSPHTGEIFSLVSKPSFDPNSFIEGKDVEYILKDKRNPLINRAIQARYPPGSVFKPIVAIAGLEEKVINPHTTFFCSGKFTLADTEFSCWRRHNQEDLYDALAHSCNIYFYNLGLRLKVERIAKWAKIFGLDRKTRIDLPFEGKGLVPTRIWKRKVKKREWYGGDTVNLSIGQGYIEVTPIEVVVFISAFANQGYLVWPHLLKKVEETNFVPEKKLSLGVSKKSIEVVREGLREVVTREDGTAHLLSFLGLNIAGKTGTAQTRGKAHGWFAGFFPYQNPKYSVCVFLENGGSSYQAVKVTYQLLKRLREENLI